MFAKLFSWSAVAAMGAATMTVMPSAASAQRFVPGGYAEVVPVQYYGGGRRGYIDRRDGYRGRGYRNDRGYYGRGYRGGRGYYADRGYYGGGRGYYGRGYRCDRGTGGTILGAIAGGLLGNELGQGRYGRGDGTTGAIIGGGLGALTGRAIDRNC